ncbi:MAG: hypothetical protein IJ735_07145 [Clostridia bacterium]|nr:hypothetical protein [Clostridia bacterium]
MELEKILQYQKIDMEVYKIEKEYLQLKELENMKRILKTYAGKNNDLKQLDTSLTEALNDIERISTKIDELVSTKLQKLDLDSLTDQQSLHSMYKLISSYDEEVSALIKEAEKAIKRLSDIQYDNKRLNEEMNALNKDYSKNEASKKKKEIDMAKRLGPLSQQLKEMVKDTFDKATFEKYSTLRKARRMPAFVPYLDGNCGACGMDVKIEVDKKLLNAGDIAECPHCGRIIYKLK